MGVLLFAYLFNLSIPMLGIAALGASADAWWPVAVAGGTKLFFDMLFNVPLIFFFRKWALLLLLPVVEVFHIAYVIVIGPLSITGKYRWKDRIVQ